MDANDDWLVIYIRMKVGSETWEAKDPALLWNETRELCNWFERIAKDDSSVGGQIDFVEPVLQFEAFRQGKDKISLRAYCQEFAGPSSEDHFSKMFSVARRELADAAAGLRQELERFPSRFPDNDSEDDD